jgi:hypothetical protein
MSGASTAISRGCSGGSKRGSSSRPRSWSCSTCSSRRRVWQACTCRLGSSRRRAGSRRGGAGAAMEQVALQPAQQAVRQPAGVQRGAGIGLRIGIGGDLARRMHHLVAAQHRDEIAPGRAPGLQQRFSPACRPACSPAPGANGSASPRRSRPPATAGRPSTRGWAWACRNAGRRPAPGWR